MYMYRIDGRRVCWHRGTLSSSPTLNILLDDRNKRIYLYMNQNKNKRLKVSVVSVMDPWFDSITIDVRCCVHTNDM